MAHEEALAAVPLFSQLTRKDLTRLGRAVVERKYKAGETIVKEGEQAVAFFMITKGKVEAVTGGGKKQTKLNELGPGQVFGEMALLDGMPRVATVKAMTDTECLVLSRWDFVAELRTNPHIAVAMLPILSKRLRDADDRLREAH
jgi:CRP-like cAMP-binding protein